MKHTPNRKVVAGGLAGAVTTIATWSADAFGGIKIPGEVAAAFTTVIAVAVSYFVPEPGDYQ